MKECARATGIRTSGGSGQPCASTPWRASSVHAKTTWLPAGQRSGHGQTFGFVAERGDTGRAARAVQGRAGRAQPGQTRINERQTEITTGDISVPKLRRTDDTGPSVYVCGPGKKKVRQCVPP